MKSSKIQSVMMYFVCVFSKSLTVCILVNCMVVAVWCLVVGVLAVVVVVVVVVVGGGRLSIYVDPIESSLHWPLSPPTIKKTVL